MKFLNVAHFERDHLIGTPTTPPPAPSDHLWPHFPSCQIPPDTHTPPSVTSPIPAITLVSYDRAVRHEAYSTATPPRPQPPAPLRLSLTHTHYRRGSRSDQAREYQSTEQKTNSLFHRITLWLSTPFMEVRPYRTGGVCVGGEVEGGVSGIYLW